MLCGKVNHGISFRPDNKKGRMHWALSRPNRFAGYFFWSCRLICEMARRIFSSELASAGTFFSA